MIFRSSQAASEVNTKVAIGLSNLTSKLLDLEYGNQVLQFIEKSPSAEDSSKLVTVNNGTTNEEVLAVLIDRLNYLHAKFPCRENAIAITHVETALLWLNHRTVNRQARGVEGKHLK